MKLTHREDWRVIIEIAPRSTRILISALGLVPAGSDLDGSLDGEPFELTIAPRRLGDLHGVSMSDRLASNDVDGDYRRRCEEMLAALLRQPHVRSGRVAVTETHTCSHCDLGWEELTADEAADSSTSFDEHSVEGEPVCCEAAIYEFRRGRGITVLTSAGGAG